MRAAALIALAVAASAPARDLDAPAPRRWTPPSISSPLYESSPVFTPDGREMYFVLADRNFRHWRLAVSHCGPDGWSPPRPVPFAGPPAALEADPFVSADGQALYYVSNRQAPEGEDLDIWVVRRGPSGAWGEPHRLPSPVNSTASELLPRLDGEGRLWFGSSREGGYGAGDIYVASPRPDGGWTVANAGPPVSTAAHEYEADISHDGRTLVLVADRGDRSHLYVFDRGPGGWIERGRVPAERGVFQVGPRLSPDARRLLFGQADGERSGEFFLADLAPSPDPVWPPACPGKDA